MNKAKVVYFLTRCKNAGPIKQTANIIKYLDREKYSPIVVTMFPENKNDSLLGLYEKLDIDFYSLNSTKKEMILKGKEEVKNLFNKIQPEIIHAVGMEPYKLANNYSQSKSIVTVRNYFFDDYPAKHGKILGNLMAYSDLRVLKKNSNIVTCSESLSKIYQEKEKINLPYIRNGVDIENYTRINFNKKNELKKRINLPLTTKVAIYTGQFLDRKNQEFAIKQFIESEFYSKLTLVLAGEGKNLSKLKEKYGHYDNLIFTGQVSNVEEYLQAADFYLSTSKSEGMPNGVLEAMAVGLPVLLSDILQHREILEINDSVGFLYKNGDSKSFHESLNSIMTMDLEKAGEISNQVVNNHLNAKLMSNLYQRKYDNILQ